MPSFDGKNAMPMKYLQNLHTHTAYCDGKDTPEEMLRYAMEKGFESIGFSGHSYMFYSPGHSMSLAGTEDYKREITALKEQYAGEIGVYLGLEFDLFSVVDLTGYDYLIGSVHYLKLGDSYVGFDRGAEEVRRIIDTHFGGDGLAFAKEYYRLLATLPDYGAFDVLGHIDLITKNCEKTFLFDPASKEYLSAAFEAIDALTGRIPFFEVNTGAIARGYRTTPYPSIPIMKELKRRGWGAVISSDCHDGRFLDCAFEQARQLLAECGFTERYTLTDSGFTSVAL